MSQSISLGMYSLNTGLEAAWRGLFLEARKLRPDLDIPTRVINSVDMVDVINSSTRLSHICGLPLVSQFQGRLMPLCAPHFDVEGIDGPEYFSYFMVRKNSHIQSIEQSRDCVVAINSIDSNSGMGVFRHELKKNYGIDQLEFFFQDIIYSGAHTESVQYLLEGKADIAAIDAVTYNYLQDINPELALELRIVGHSVKMTSPPLVTHIGNPICDPASFTQILNDAFEELSKEQRELLNVKSFLQVSNKDYMPMLAL
tara:strand:+ start:392 stop:1159 length:768 start_codon:yes stop_codon:yes gene_type:complete